MNRFWKFISEIFSDPKSGGKVSWGRVMASILIFVVVIGELVSIIKNSKFIEVPSSLVTLIGTLALYNLAPKVFKGEVRIGNGKQK